MSLGGKDGQFAKGENGRTGWPIGNSLAEPWDACALDRDLIPANRAEAYFVQDQMHAKLGLELAGWKVGATSPTMREIDGHEDVIPGRIFSVRTYLGTRHSLRPCGKAARNQSWVATKACNAARIAS